MRAFFVFQVIIPNGFFYAVKYTLVRVQIAVPRYKLVRIVRGEFMYLKPRRPKSVRRSSAHRQHPVPSIAVGVHILLRYGIIGQQVYLHRRYFIFFVYHVSCLLQVSVYAGQRSVKSVLFTLPVPVVYDDLLTFVEVEFCIELRLFRQQLFQFLRLIERLFRLFFGDGKVAFQLLQPLFQPFLAGGQIREKIFQPREIAARALAD